MVILFVPMENIVEDRKPIYYATWQSKETKNFVDMLQSRIRQIGFLSGMVLVGLGIIYICLIVILMLSGSGFPPLEPYQTMFNILILFTAVWMVLFWTIVNYVAPAEKKLFSQASLALIVIFATLTSINRYVGLTVVKQSLSAGDTNGLEWFMPYQWPSVMMAIEFLAWGFFFGLACLCLAPVFKAGRLGNTIFWILIITGSLSLLTVCGQVASLNALSFNLFTFAGTLAWGPGLTTAIFLIAIWFREAVISSK
jgi:hypothetical protein